MESLGNTWNGYCMSGTLLALTKGNFLQMMDSFGFGQILLIGALICWVVLHLIGEKSTRGH